MLSHFGQIRDVANMISLSILIHVFITHPLTGKPFHGVKRLKNGTGIASSAANVVGLTTPWRGDELLNESSHVIGVDVVSHLFSFVPIDLVKPFGQIDLHQVTEEPVEFHS
jgi:hypothetical protein